MTNEKFIEQLNLYLDGELPPNEAAELEHAIASSVERRRIYRQYCQMQNACAGLAEQFREEAAPAPHFRRGKVVELSARASGDWVRSLVLVASGALAACAVFVALRQVSPGQAANTVASNGPAPTSLSQPVPYTTTVAANGAPAGFRNPWVSSQQQPVLDFARRAPVAGSLVLNVPADTKLGSGEVKVELQPYGKAAGAPLQMEEIQAAAFQFQR